ncbi:MAG: hypothetical protein AAF907_13945 [Planctomycetota bacterium]
MRPTASSRLTDAHRHTGSAPPPARHVSSIGRSLDPAFRSNAFPEDAPHGDRSPRSPFFRARL